MNYTLGNAQSYNRNTNYTRVWYHLGWPNPTGGSILEGGGWSPWTFATYSFPNCSYIDTSSGGDDLEDYKDSPYFGASCRTKEGGECEATT